MNMGYMGIDYDIYNFPYIPIYLTVHGGIMIKLVEKESGKIIHVIEAFEVENGIVSVAGAIFDELVSYLDEENRLVYYSPIYYLDENGEEVTDSPFTDENLEYYDLVYYEIASGYAHPNHSINN